MLACSREDSPVASHGFPRAGWVPIYRVQRWLPLFSNASGLSERLLSVAYPINGRVCVAVLLCKRTTIRRQLSVGAGSLGPPP